VLAGLPTISSTSCGVMDLAHQPDTFVAVGFSKSLGLALATRLLTSFSATLSLSLLLDFGWDRWRRHGASTRLILMRYVYDRRTTRSHVQETCQVPRLLNMFWLRRSFLFLIRVSPI